MKHFLSVVLAFVLCICFAPPVAVQGLPSTDFTIPFSQEALLSSLYEADISTLRHAIDTGLVTCEELTAYYLERIEDYNKPYNCFITICDDAATEPQLTKEILSASNANFQTLIPTEEMYTQLLAYVYAFPTTFFVDSEGIPVVQPLTGVPSMENAAEAYYSIIEQVLQLMEE